MSMSSRFIAALLLFFMLSASVVAQNVPAPEAMVAPPDPAEQIDLAAPEIVPSILRRVASEGSEDEVFYAPAGVERMRIDSDTGYVGIGTNGTAPPYDLFVKRDVDGVASIQVETLDTGSSAVSLLRAYSDTAAVNVTAHGSGRTLSRFGTALGGWGEILAWRGSGVILGTLHSAPVTLGTSGANRLHIAADGKIGIGTSAPSAQVHVYGEPTKDSYVGFGTHVMDGPSANFGMAGASYGRSAAFINVRPDALAVAPNPSLRFLTANVQRMIITNTGRIGIGTLAPAETLDVAGGIHATGDIRADGVIHAKYQDIAEWVPSNSDLPPGTVVVLDPALGNGVMASSASYDTAVAGVVSAQPGIILGEAGAAKEQVATTGRVRVRVDASAAPIRVGDLLVTSDRPGMAMRSEPMDIGGRKFHQPGTIIGKALESLEGGEGEILVLLSLQ